MMRLNISVATTLQMTHIQVALLSNDVFHVASYIVHGNTIALLFQDESDDGYVFGM